MTPAMRSRLQAASDHVLARIGERMDAATIIAELVGQHRASFTTSASTNTLRVAGVQAICTWSKDTGLLDAWRRLAFMKLIEPEGGFGGE